MDRKRSVTHFRQAAVPIQRCQAATSCDCISRADRWQEYCATCEHSLQVSECIMARTPLCFVRRDHFLEEPYLRKLLAQAGGAIEISRADLIHGHWGPYLQQALRAQMSYECASTRLWLSTLPGVTTGGLSGRVRITTTALVVTTVQVDLQWRSCAGSRWMEHRSLQNISWSMLRSSRCR